MQDWKRWKDNYKIIALRLHKIKDGDIMKRLDEVDIMQAYIKELIRKDIRERGE